MCSLDISSPIGVAVTRTVAVTQTAAAVWMPHSSSLNASVVRVTLVRAKVQIDSEAVRVRHRRRRRPEETQPRRLSASRLALTRADLLTCAAGRPGAC